MLLGTEIRLISLELSSDFLLSSDPSTTENYVFSLQSITIDLLRRSNDVLSEGIRLQGEDGVFSR